MSNRKRAVIIGAGPAGLTAGYELLTRSDIQPLVLEKRHIWAASRGGDRFFSKSDRVMRW
jgi:flavin-dependent dehydrogenase